MKLILVPPAEAPVSYRCLGCEKWKTIRQAGPSVYADLDGKAFVAYYCAPCVQDARAKEMAP